MYCRPLDSQASRRVKSESCAFMESVRVALQGEVTLVSSDYVRFEILKIQDSLKRKDVRGFVFYLEIGYTLSLRYISDGVK